MTTHEKLAFKTKLKQLGLALLRQRITTAETAMNRAQESANTEEKSSAGDKYETGRAMGQLEKEMYARQLAAYAADLKTLRSNALGAFIRCKEIAFFVSAGLGKQQVDGQNILFISPIAPLARSLQNKQPGDTIPFNGTTLIIEEIF